MNINAISSASQLATSPPPEPPQPSLTSVEQGDLKAGRIRVAEGQVFSGTSESAPKTADWGAQPQGTAYRAAFEGVAARLGTSDPDIIGAELDRQLAASLPAAPAPAEPSREGAGSFLDGAVMGDFADNNSWSATAGQVAIGFVPIAGQIADARDSLSRRGGRLAELRRFRYRLGARRRRRG
jgi:hypothetical protein